MLVFRPEKYFAFAKFQCYIIQMYLSEHQSPLATLRQLCFDIENNVNTILSTTKGKSDSFTLNQSTNFIKPNNDFGSSQTQRLFDQLKNSIVQTVTSRLPQVIKFQENLKDQIEDLQQQRDSWHEKYKKILGSYEGAQLANDKMKIEIIGLSDSYENLTISYEELKFKYHQLKQKQTDFEQSRNQELYMQKIAQINQINKNSSNSASNESQKDNTKNQQQLLVVERQLFLDEIKESQREILVFRTKMEELLEQNEKFMQENKEMSHELKGEKLRCDKLDRQVIELLNKIEELKLEKAENQQTIKKLNQKVTQQSEQLQKEKEKIISEKTKTQELKKEIGELKQSIMGLKLENSQQRQKNHRSQQIQKQQKERITEMRKESQKLKNEVQKILNQAQANKTTLKQHFTSQLQNARNELAKEINKNAEIHKQTKKGNQEKLQGICRMHKEITAKLEHKILLLEKDCKEKKEKNAQLKYQVERLYQSLQIQVQKQYKSSQKVKELSQSNTQLNKVVKQLTEKVESFNESQSQLKSNKKEITFELSRKQKKLKHLNELHNRLSQLVLPKMKQELASMRQTCSHFCKMIEMQKEEVNYLLQKKQQHFNQLLAQIVMQSNLNSQQERLNFQTQLGKWKENCKNYEEKYSKLKQSYEHLSQKSKKQQQQQSQTLHQKEQRIEELQEKLDRQHLQHVGTLKTIDKLKEKCKEVQQYYKLVQDLQKENFKLKDKLTQVELYSFNKAGQAQLNHTRQRQKFTQDPPIKQNKTFNNKSTAVEFHQNQLNDITTKAQLQKMRLQAVKREYDLVSRNQY